MDLDRFLTYITTTQVLLQQKDNLLHLGEEKTEVSNGSSHTITMNSFSQDAWYLTTGMVPT